MLLFTLNVYIWLENTGTNAKSAIYKMLFTTMTSSLRYIMTSFIKLMWGWTAYRNSLERVFNVKLAKTVAISMKETENLLNLASDVILR